LALVSGRHFPIVLWLAFLLLLLPASDRLNAQAINAQLQGTVMDNQGAGISGASITVRNTATGITRVVKADDQGRYQAPNLQPGPYEVTVEAQGFSHKVFSGITLNVGDVQRLDAPVDVGSQSESVDVTAGESLMQTQTSSNGTLVDNKQVVELPLANRQFYSLALLSPAAFQPAQNSTLGFRGGINIAGATEISNQFTVNGIYDNDMGVAQPSFRPSVEVIQEFRLLTGVYSAEYGRMSGGQVVIITKSGTNSFHGSGYEFIRNQVTDAKPYFTALGASTPAFKQNTFGGTVGGPIWRDRTFFFFGYEGQRIRQAVTAQATVPTSDMLNGAFNTGEILYNPGTGAPLTPVTPGTTSYNLATALAGTRNFQWGSTGAVAGQTIARLGFPTPTISTALGKLPTNNYTFQETRTENMNEFTARADHRFSDKDSINGSFNLFKDPAFEPSNSLCSSYVLPNFGCFTNQISTLVNVTYDRIITPNVFNDLRLGFQRLQQPRVQQDDTTIGSAYSGLPGGSYFTQPGYANNLGLPNTSVSGYATVGGATNLPQNRWDNHYQIADTITWNHGAHTFKAGVDLLLARSTNVITSSGRGAFVVNDASIVGANSTASSTPHLGSTGDSLADLLLGLTYTSTVGPTAGTVYMNFQSEHFFVLDDWKVKPNLTLNLGMRYEVDAPVYSPNNSLSNFDLPTQQFLQVGTNGYTKGLYKGDYNNIAPRIGFSWQPYNSESTVIKGATGIFYNTPLLYNQFLTDGTQAPFRFVSTYTTAASVAATDTVNTISMAAPFSVPNTTVLPPCVTGGQTSCAATLSPLSINPNYRTPYLTEWSIGVQQSMTKSMVFESTYFGSKGTKLPLSISLNVVNPATYAVGTRAPNQSDRPYPNFSVLSSQDTRGDSEFHSWQNSLKQTYTNGVTFILAYTFSKSIDGGGGIGSSSNSSGNPQNPYNLRADRGLSDFDVRHRVVFSPVAELPFGRNKAYLNHGLSSAILGGFQLSGIFSFQTGRPFTVSDSSTNNSGYYGNADRPNVIANPNSSVNTATGVKTHTVAQWFNTAAFQLAPAFKITNGVVTQVGQFGNAGRNTVAGPAYTDLDLTLSRNFHIWERVGGQFRAESFNVFNHPNFFNPLTTGVQLGAQGFGAITQANTPRDMQFSMRILF
jgi:hypothetical protein